MAGGVTVFHHADIISRDIGEAASAGEDFLAGEVSAVEAVAVGPGAVDPLAVVEQAEACN